MRGINPIYKYLSGSSSQIENLVAQVNHLKKLDHTLKQVLDADLAPHCRIGQVQGNEISILVDSPVWATQLQYKKPEILLKFNKLYKKSSISRIHIKIVPREQRPSQEKTENRISNQSEIGSQCLETLASTMPDTTLGTALRRLSSRLKKP